MTQDESDDPVTTLTGKIEDLVKAAEEAGGEVVWDDARKRPQRFIIDTGKPGGAKLERIFDDIRGLLVLRENVEFLWEVAKMSNPLDQKKLHEIIALLLELPDLRNTARKYEAMLVRIQRRKRGRPRKRDLDEAVAFWVKAREGKVVGNSRVLTHLIEGMRPGKLLGFVALRYSVTPLALWKRLESEKEAGRILVPIGTRPKSSIP